MSLAFLRQRRRPLVLGTLVVLLHWLVLGWLTAGTQGLSLPGRDGGDVLSVTRLLPPRAAPPPEPVPPPAPKMAQPALPDFDPLPSNMVVEDAVGERLPPGPPLEALPAPGPATDAVAATVPVAAPAAGPAIEPEAPPAQDLVRRYKVDVPPPAELTLDVARQDADGTRWSGQAVLSWKRDQQGAYQVRIEAGIRVVFARVNLVVLTSEGQVGSTGLAPLRMTEKRRGRALTATHFDWPASKVTFSGSQASYTLPPGAQDKATVPLQLAAIARGDPAQLSGDIDMFVGEDRDGSVYTFRVVGQEDIDTPIGRLHTVRLTRPPKAGSYKSRLDIWLAPAHGWMPVQIRSSEANGAVTTQTVNKIAMTQPGF